MPRSFLGNDDGLTDCGGATGHRTGASCSARRLCGEIREHAEMLLRHENGFDGDGVSLPQIYSAEERDV